DGGSPITSYEYRDEVDGRMGDWTDTGSTATSLTMAADIGTAIAYEVRTRNAVGPGASMKSNSVTPMNPVVDPVPPGAPTDVTAAAGDGTVTLTWTAPADNGGAAILRYEYISRVDGRADEEWMSTGSTATTVTVDADNGTAIAYDVRAVNSAGGGAAARSNTVTPMAALTAPGVPRNLTAVAGDTEVVLDWDAPNSGGAPSGYDYRVTGSGVSGEWTNTTATRATVTGLTNDTEYTFYVRAVNSAGMSGEVSEEATPMAPPPGVQVTVKEVKTSTTNVPESGGLEVTVVANVPAGTKGSDDKVAPIAMRRVMVEFPTDDTSIKAGENADDGELTPLGDLLWEKITRTEKDSTQEFKFRVAVGQDLDAEDEKFQVEVSIDGASMKSKVITIDDAQEQTYELSLPSDAKGAVKEGGSETLTLAAKPERTIDIGFTLALNPNDPTKYTLGATSGTFGTDSASTTISAKADGNRDDDTVTVTAYMSGTLGNNVEIDSLDITVTDINALPMVKAEVVDSDGKAVSPQPESVAEGGSLKVKLTVVDKDGKAAKAAEKLSISLMPTGTADGQDYRLSTHPIEIAKDKESSAVVDLMVTEDSDVGDETLMFTAVVSGDSKIGTEKKEVPGVLSLMITDGTEKLVWANSQAEVEAAIYAAKNAGAGDDMTLTEGEMIEVMGNALFSKAEGVTLSYTAESSMGSVASAAVNGAAVTITAMSEGTTEITITAHASRPSGVMILDQTDPGMASIMFPVEVGLEALAITLTGPEDMNLAEGMSAMVTATANRPVSADTTVMLMRDRSKSTAGDADYSADAITISAGVSSGTTMVMAVEDGVAEDMEELVLYGMTEGMAGEVTGEVKLYLWDATVPALPIIAQLLLGGLLAVGGIRRYRRRS
ncbi:MAG: fibronectin type III domain-containing protein, partial [Gemmatimonadetes bacterium]|nr:fibronectin type III domain-containing protein [Gemmatimonadota bacterium]